MDEPLDKTEGEREEEYDESYLVASIQRNEVRRKRYEEGMHQFNLKLDAMQADITNLSDVIQTHHKVCFISFYPSFSFSFLNAMISSPNRFQKK